jgi:hypothetical protein
MDLVERTVDLAQAIEATDWFQVESMTTDDFQYYGVTPDPIDKETWLAFLEAIKSGIPDLALHITDLKEVRGEVHCVVRLEGHHTQPLRLPWPNTPELPATLTHVHLPPERVTVKFHNDLISEIRTSDRLHTGLLGILEQIGVQ